MSSERLTLRAAPASLPAAFAEAFRKREFVVDLGDRVGSTDWWRGVLTLILMILTVLVLVGARQTDPIVFPLERAPLDSPALSALQPAVIGPLAQGGRTGEQVLTMSARVVEIDGPFVRARVNESAVVNPGERLESVLERVGLSRSKSYNLVALVEKETGLRTISDGTRLRATLGRLDPASNRRPLEKAEYRGAFDTVVRVEKSADGYQVSTVPVPVVSAPARVVGTVGSSLYVAARRAGVPPRVIAEYTKALSYAVDFQRDVIAKDGFTMVFERDIAEDGQVRYGQLLYAQMELAKRGKTVELVRFTPSGEKADFFHADGKSIRQLLMKTPISGSFRKSSGFGMRRHPILGYSRMHKGVDFAAPTGTPVLAAGSGTIEVLERQRGYGNYIRIRHANGYSTAYAHLHRFSPGLRKGSRVQQGQVIAQVGSTGMSTGPHLHYEVLRNGTHLNPNSSAIPQGRTLTGAELKRLTQQLDSFRKIPPNVTVDQVLASQSFSANAS